MGRWDSKVLLKAAFCHSLWLPVFVCKSIQYWVPVLDWELLCVCCTQPEATGCLASTLPHIHSLLPATDHWNIDCHHRLSLYWLMFAIWSCMDRQTHSRLKHSQTQSIDVHFMLLHYSIILGGGKWATKGQNIRKWLSAILCSTCLIQWTTAQYALLIPLALCSASISHDIYVVFKGLTQILQSQESHDRSSRDSEVISSFALLIPPTHVIHIFTHTKTL